MTTLIMWKNGSNKSRDKVVPSAGCFSWNSRDLYYSIFRYN